MLNVLSYLITVTVVATITTVACNKIASEILANLELVIKALE